MAAPGTRLRAGMIRPPENRSKLAGWMPVPTMLFLAAAAIGVQPPLPSVLAARPPVPAFLAMPSSLPVQPGQWIAVNAFPRLAFNVPTFLTAAPRTSRLYVLEREGVIKTFENDPITAAVTTVLDIQDRCQGRSDCGLLGLAFHPDFGKPGSPNRGYFYIIYNYSEHPVRAPAAPVPDMPTWDRVSRFTVADGSLTADPNSELVLIEEEDRQLFHTGGGMFFHPEDGFLYVSLGDEGGGGGQLGNCQRIDRNLYGGVIRIDVAMDAAHSHPPKRQPANGKTAHYWIPNDNPFVGVPGVLEEFWCLGLRNPHRMTYDAATRRIWVGDVGDGGADPREEIDLIEKGGNYQWCYKEGTADRPEFALRPVKIIGVEKPPLYEYPHTNGNRCVIGGYVYHGKQHAGALGGKYIFGDYGCGRIWAMTYAEGKAPVVEELCTLPARANLLASFGMDRDGELYFCEVARGLIFKLARAGSPAAPLAPPRPLPRLLSETGTFTDVRTLTSRPGLLPYQLNVASFADGAVKKHWIALPCSGPTPAPPERIRFAPTGEWTFPTGSVLVQHLELPVDEVNCRTRLRLETRLLVRDPDGSVYGVTYRWRADGSEAELLEGSLTENLTVSTAAPIGSLTGTEVGGPMRAGNDHATADGCAVVAPGGQIGGTADRCHFAWQERAGDFDVKVCAAGLQEVPAEAWTGLMVRESLEPGSRQVAALVRLPSRGGVKYAQRLRRQAEGRTETRPLEGPPATAGWVRLKRQGDRFSTYVDSDGYRWTPLGTSTLHLPATVYVGLAAATAPGVAPATVTLRHLTNNREQQWYYPSRQECLTCHNANAGYILGVKTRQLNGDYRDAASGVSDNQLRTWNHLGLFEPPVDENNLVGYSRLVQISDKNAQLSERVRSYLDVNCAHCHRPNGAHAMFDARFDTPLSEQNIVGGPVHADLGVADARAIAPRNDAQSILYCRLKSCDAIRMPPLGRSLQDVEGTAAVREWISSLPVAGPKQKKAKHLAVLGGSCAGMLVVSGLLRWLLRRRAPGRGPRERVLQLLPLALGLSVPFLGVARNVVGLFRGQHSLTLGTTGLILGLLALFLFNPRTNPLALVTHLRARWHMPASARAPAAFPLERTDGQRRDAA